MEDNKTTEKEEGLESCEALGEGSEIVNSATDELRDSETLNDEYEYYDIEVSEDDIVAYLEDEEGNSIGFVVEEDGVEVEYYYCTDDELNALDTEDESNSKPDSKVRASDADEYDLGITREGVAQVTNDANAIYKDGVVVVSELKGAFDDIKEAFTFKSPKK